MADDKHDTYLNIKCVYKLRHLDISKYIYFFVFVLDTILCSFIHMGIILLYHNNIKHYFTINRDIFIKKKYLFSLYYRISRTRHYNRLIINLYNINIM